MRTGLAALAVLAAMSFAGCGGAGDSDEARSERAVERAEMDLKISKIESTFAEAALVDAKYQAASLREQASGNYPPVSAEQANEVSRGVEDLIRLCRENPNGIYETDSDGKRTMRQVLEDDVETLRKFQPEAATRLKSVSDNGCG
jgi:hypothetical protein